MKKTINILFIIFMTVAVICFVSLAAIQAERSIDDIFGSDFDNFILFLYFIPLFVGITELFAGIKKILLGKTPGKKFTFVISALLTFFSAACFACSVSMLILAFARVELYDQIMLLLKISYGLVALICMARFLLLIGTARDRN